MVPPKSGATKTAAVLVALVATVSVVTVGVVAQPYSPNTNSSDEDAEPNDTMANATPIEYGSEIDGTLSSPDDVDYYAVDATAGCAILPRLHLENVFEGSGIQVDVVAPTGEVTTELTNDLMTGPQNSVGAASTLSGSDVAYTGDVTESNGTYYVRVMEATNFPVGSPRTNASDTYRYDLTVNRAFLDRYEPNENGSTATPIEPDDAVDATFAGYDSDVYALNVTAGESYTVDISSPSDLNPDHATKVLYVYANRSQAADDPPWQYAEDGKSPYYREPNGSTVATSGTIRDGPTSVEFTAETNGTYYLQFVQDPQNLNLDVPGEYRLAVNDDRNGDATNATTLSSDESVLATLSPGEEDWYAVTGRVGNILDVSVWSRGDTPSDAVEVDLVTANGSVLEESPGTDTDPRSAARILRSNGTHYVRVRNTGTNVSERHDYGLGIFVAEMDRYDPNENGSTATPLAVNETITAEISDRDSDVYRVDAEAGETYTVTLNETNYIDPERRLLVYDDAADVRREPTASNATPVANTSGSGSWSNVTFTAETDGAYYVQVVSGVDERPPYLNYELTVSPSGDGADSGIEDSDSEPNDGLENATPIAYGENVTAALSSGDDVDYYSVNVTAGAAIAPRLYLENVFEGSAIRVDVVAPTGEVTTELTNDQNDGPDNVAGTAVLSPTDTARTGDVMEADGTYYVRVMEADRTSSGAVRTSTAYRYNLTVNSAVLDRYEPNENGTTAAPVDLGETVNAALAGYDSDVYAVNLTAGKTYALTTRSPGSRYSYDVHGVMRIYGNQSQPVDDPDNGSPRQYDPNGSTVATSTTLYGETESVVFTPSTDGTYYVHVVQDPNNANLLPPSPYELTVTETGPDDGMANALPVEYEQDVVATLSAGEVDWYAVDGDAGRELRVDVWSREYAFEGLLQIDLLTASGDVVAESSPGADNNAEYVMESNETYYIRVSESPTGEADEVADYGYRLHAEADEFDAEDSNENESEPASTPVTATEATRAVGQEV